MAITEARPEAAAADAHGISPRRHPIVVWLTTTDHKKIGIMYLVNSYLWFGVAGLLAVFIRAELAQPGTQFFAEQRYNELFTMHGTTMIFLFIIPILAGFGNYIVPLQIGALDMAFPRVNALSFWMLPLAGIVLFSSYLLGGPADGGWTQYAPLSEGIGAKANSIGVDLWVVALLLVGTSSILGSVNFLTTIFNMRAPGMTMFRMPIFTWTVLVTQLLVLLATPVITSALAMLFLDRNLGGSFFNPAKGGIAILWQNVFWFYSHPAVYIMVLPGMGIVSDVLPVFSRKPLFGYKAFVFATAGIGALGFSVWAHHMFATGQVLLPFFSIMTFLIAVPTGV
jgi:cytochrome c oxidase subunit 1